MCNKLGNTEQQPDASESQLELWTGESVPNMPCSWWTNHKICGLFPMFGHQMMAEDRKQFHTNSELLIINGNLFREYS